MKFKLRPYQKSDLKLLKKTLKKHPHTLFGASVGFGKSIIISKMVQREVKKGGRVLVIAPRRKLVRQLFSTLEEFHPSLIMGTDTYYDEFSDVFVASASTLHNRIKKHGKKYLGDVTLVLYDEVHIGFNGVTMDSVKKLYWEKAKWVGLSGTPIDGAGYRLEGWDKTIYEHQMQDLIELGWLTPVNVMVEEVPKGLEDVGLTGGDYNEAQLAEFMSDDARVSNVYSVWKKYAQGRKTMVFAVNIAHAEILHEDFIKHGVNAGIVHSDLDEAYEDETLNHFENGDMEVLVNIGKLTAGYDAPIVDCIIYAKPTRVTSLFCQITGRALRLFKPLDSILNDLKGSLEYN